MSAGAEAALADLRTRARTALAAGDHAAAAAVLAEAAALDVEGADATRGLGLGFSALAVEGFELPEPALIEAIFNRALKTFQSAPDTQLGDLLTTWNNLATLYDRHGASALRNGVMATMGGVAERYAGPLDSTCATVFMQLGDLFRGQRNYPATLVMYRQVQRFMAGDRQVPDGTRALWLTRFASGLSEAGTDSEIEPAIEQALATIEGWGDAPLSSVACWTILAACREKRADWVGAAPLVERAAAVTALPAGERTDLLSRAGRAWFNAGEFDEASRCYRRAVRRRIGLEDVTVT